MDKQRPKRDYVKIVDVDINSKINNKDKKIRFENVVKLANKGFKKNPIDWNIKLSKVFSRRKAELWHDDSYKLMTLYYPHKYYMIWLGHSTFYLYLNGLRILFDPVFGKVPFVKRIIELPINPLYIRDIDYIFISHDHYDHLDRKSIRTVLSQSRFCRIICGNGTEQKVGEFVSWRNKYHIETLNWYERLELDGFKATFLPSVHWSRRGVADSRTRLWGAFVIEYEGLKIYFSGDTSYGEHFKEVKELFGKVDYSIIGIGAFRPRPHVHRNHISPREAVRAAIDMDARVTVPMHYNTFDLSSERYIEPLYIFKKAAEINNVNISTPVIGEMMELIPNTEPE